MENKTQYKIILEYGSSAYERRLNELSKKGGQLVPFSIKVIQTKSDLCYFAVVEFPERRYPGKIVLKGK
jgi:hypothetical protein